MNISKETYLKYLSFGWTVIPWRLSEDFDGSVKKSPALPTWREFEKRKPTEAELDEWDGKYNAIAVVTGRASNLTIVDIDTHDEASLPFQQLKAEIVASSAFSGGKHYYFAYTEQGRTTSKLDNSPVDMRSDGGVIILPPSNLGERKYTFEKLGSVSALSQVPPDIIEAINKKKTELAIPIGDELPHVTSGDRNETAARVLGSLFARIDYGLRDEVIWPAVVNWNNTKVEPPLPEYELRRTFESIRDAHARNHPDLILTPEDFDRPKSLSFVAVERSREYEMEAIAPKTGFFSLDEKIRGFIPGRLYTLTGETNVGKTAMCCNFAYNVASQGRRVLYFALEPGNTLVDYISSVKFKTTYDEGKKRIFELNESIDVFTTGVRSIDQLNVIVKKLDRYDLIIIDHISYFITNGENYTQEQSNAIKQLALSAKENKVAILMVAHINKQSSMQKKEIDYNSISGSAAFKQDSTDVLLVTRDKEEPTSGKIIVAKTKSGPVGECAIRFTPASAYITEGVMTTWQPSTSKSISSNVSYQR